MIGDVDQLPSVGGREMVLTDLIASGEVTVVTLTEIFRQAPGKSYIVTNAHRINRGRLSADDRSG